MSCTKLAQIQTVNAQIQTVPVLIQTVPALTDLLSLTILPRDSRFPGQSQGLTISYKKSHGKWIIGFLKFNSQVVYFSKDWTAQSIFGRQAK